MKFRWDIREVIMALACVVFYGWQVHQPSWGYLVLVCLGLSPFFVEAIKARAFKLYSGFGWTVIAITTFVCGILLCFEDVLPAALWFATAAVFVITGLVVCFALLLPGRSPV